MKISLITRHAVSNYGSLLQAYATQRLLECMGHEVEIVDYVRRDEEPIRIDRTLLATKPRWNRSLLRRAAYIVLRTPESIISGESFARARGRLLTTSMRYGSIEELKEYPPQADLYMVGSDQVWGPVSAGQIDVAYTLSYAPEGARKMSFAASFGKSALRQSDIESLAKRLGGFSRLLVREEEAVRMLRSWGLGAERVLDPTLMLSGRDWRSFAGSSAYKGYVLVYQIHNNQIVSRYAERASQYLGLPLVRISPVLHQCVRGGRFKYLPTVEQFVRYIDNASLLVTDSFHGTAFAINLNTPFVEVLPQNGTSIRNTDILKLVDLESRIARNVDDLSVIEEDIDFDSMNTYLERLREESLELLTTAVEGV